MRSIESGEIDCSTTAAKYKTYNKLRVQSLSKNPFATQPSTSSPPPPSKKKQLVPLSQKRAVNAVTATATTSKPRDRSPASSRARHPSSIDPYDPPSNNPTPTSFRTRQVIGPTPQKNGHVLGLFDLLSPPSSKKAATFVDQTPSRKNRHLQTTRDESNNSRASTAVEPSMSQQIEANLATPSKSRAAHRTNRPAPTNLLSTPFQTRKYSQTPESSGKRKFLDAFLTSSSRRANALPVSHSLREEVLGLTTPSSKRRKQLAAKAATGKAMDVTLTPSSKRATEPKAVGDETPVFLLRYVAPVSRAPFARPASFGTSFSAAADARADSALGKDIPTAVAHARPVRRKPMARSLSAMVQSLREAEDDRLDEEMEIMRELEMEAEGGCQPRKLQKERSGEIEGDSQKRGNKFAQTTAEDDVGEMPLGADGEWEQQGEEVDEGEDTQRVRKVWKKKGQKRTTRRVRMKPQTSKWMPEAEWVGSSDEEVDASGSKKQKSAEGDEDVVIGEKQIVTDVDGDSDNADVPDAEETNDLAYEEEIDQSKEEQLPRKRGRPKGKVASEKAKGSRADGKQEGPEKAKQKPGRKVNPAAHANFRALKLRNKNSKGGKGRFGRRR